MLAGFVLVGIIITAIVITVVVMHNISESEDDAVKDSDKVVKQEE